MTAPDRPRALEKLLLRPVEVAEVIGLGRSKTYELIRDGTIPSVRLGTSIRVSARELASWVESLTHEGETT